MTNKPVVNEKLYQLLKELVFKYIPHNGVYAESDITQAHDQIIELFREDKCSEQKN